MRAILLCAALLGSCSAPGEAEQDAKVPGTLLGTFAVNGLISQDECGADLLGAPNPWKFPVRLSRFQSDLYWLNGREAIVGEMDIKAKTFGFSTRVDVAVSPARGASPGCIVSRFDRADGTITLEGEELQRFAGTLSFEYRPKNSSECFEIIGVPGGFNGLPCRLTYRIAAERTDPQP